MIPIYSLLTLALLCMTVLQFFAAACQSSLLLYAAFLLLSALVPLLILAPERRKYRLKRKTPCARPAAEFFKVLPFFLFMTMLIAIPASYLTGGNVIEPTRENLPFLLIGSVFLAALTEEAVFRFGALPLLAAQNRASGLLFSALLFAFAHMSLGSMLYAFPAGLILGAVTLRFGSPLPAFLLHLLNNLLSVCLLYAPHGDFLYIALLLLFFVCSLPFMYSLYKEKTLVCTVKSLRASESRAAVKAALYSPLCALFLLYLTVALLSLFS